MLRGAAFMIMWHDIAPEAEAEYHRWHSIEHMPERLGHPGFLRSRRGVNWQYEHQRYFTLYEGESLEAFRSEDYLRSLNNPTDWTAKMAPHFRNFLRCACEINLSTGRGIGGALATFRGRIARNMSEDGLVARLAPNGEPLMVLNSLSGMHIAFARPEYSGGATKETQLRPQMREAGFDFVVMVESFGLNELKLLMPEVVEQLQALGCHEVVSHAYETAYTLERS